VLLAYLVALLKSVNRISAMISRISAMISRISAIAVTLFLYC